MKLTYNQHTRQSGFVALLSTIIIGAVLLVMTVEAGQAGFYTRSIVLGTEAQAQSRTLAWACTNEALAKVLVDTTWSGNATTTTSEGTCYIYSIQKQFPTPQSVTIRVRGEVRERVTNLVLEYHLGNIHQGAVPRPQATSPEAVTVPTLVNWAEVAVMP